MDFTTDHVQAQAHLPHPVILSEKEGLEAKAFEWGVISDYMKTSGAVKKGRASMCNARSEKVVTDTASYWHRIRENRCLIPVTGIYEHREVKTFKNRIPYHISIKDREVFYLPALFAWSPYPDAITGAPNGTFAVITRSANEVMKQIHNSGENAQRMPLFLPEELERKWLDPGLNDQELRDLLAYELPAGDLNYYTVQPIRTAKSRVGLQPKSTEYAWPGLPALGTDDPVQQQSLF